MTITGNEVGVANQVRRDEELSKSPAGGLIESGLPVAGAAVSLGTALVSGGSTGMVLAGSIVAASGIVDWFRKLGTSKVSENLEALGQATEDALKRVESALKEYGTSIDEIKGRLESQELKNAMAAASLQALRTTQQQRLKRLALILANGVKNNDLTPESTDDMMRAAVELTQRDVQELRVFVFRQSEILAQAEQLPNSWYDNIRSRWQSWAIEDNAAFRKGQLSYFELISSRSKLAAFGFIIAIPPAGTTNSPDVFPYALLPEGAKFYERLQEIA